MIDIQTGDFRELSKELADCSVDLVLTDPPYEKAFLPRWSDLARVSARVLKPGGFFVSYSGKMYLPDVMASLERHLTYYWLGCLHHNGPKKTVWPHNILDGAKPILVYQKPPFARQRRRFVDYIDSVRQSKIYHEWGQSVAPLLRLIETFTDRGDVIFDPLLGGGTTAVACLQTGRDCIGYEIDAETANVARQRVGTAQLPLAPKVMAVAQGALL